jgi:O-antigen biosynthesis protein
MVLNRYKGYQMNIVCFTLVDWECLFQRPQQIAVRLARNGHFVTYFGSPTIKHNIFYYLVKNIFFINPQANKRLLILSPLASFGKRKLGSETATKKIMIIGNLLIIRIINRLFGSGKIDAWIFNEPYISSLALPYIKNGKFIYDCVDEHSGFSGAPPDMRRAEENMMKQCSLVIATSDILLQRIAKVNGKCFYLPNGSDFEHFHSSIDCKAIPEEIAGLHHPIIGFIGAVHDWIDINLVCKLAEAHSDYTILIVGPVNYGGHKLNRYRNILLVGKKSYESIPAYLSAIDVCLIPFKLNKLTLASNPIKLYEYLAAGKPVVSTDLPEVRRNASGIVYISENDAEFIAKVEEAVNEITAAEINFLRSKRINFAKKNSWQNRAEVIVKLIEEVS